MKQIQELVIYMQYAVANRKIVLHLTIHVFGLAAKIRVKSNMKFYCVNVHEHIVM